MINRYSIFGIVVLSSLFVFVLVSYNYNIKFVRDVVDDIDNMQTIALALLDYENTYGHLPKNVLCESVGNQQMIHSWRSQLLSEICGDYVNYNFNTVWSSEDNEQSRKTSNIFWGKRNLSTDHPEYLAIVVACSGEGTVFDAHSDTSHLLSSLPPDMILVLGESNLPIAPLEPRDIDASDLIHSDKTIGDILLTKKSIVVLFADMEIWVLDTHTPAKDIGAFATIRGALKNDRTASLKPWMLHAVAEQRQNR